MTRRLWSVFRKSVREQKRDLWVIGLSLAFAPIFVFIYWTMTGSSGTTSYGVLVINQDIPMIQADSIVLSAGVDMMDGLKGVKYENGGSLLRVIESTDRADAETRLRNREAAALVIIPEDFSKKLSAFKAGDSTAHTELTFIGDLTNPTYTVAAVMAMTVADAYTQEITSAARPVELVEIPLGSAAARTEFENYVPGLLVLAVVLMVFQAAMTPARDIETGAMKRLRLTRLTAFDYLGGTTLWLASVSLGSVLLTFVTAVGFGFRSQGPLWLAFLVVAITSLSIIGIGLIVACFSKTVSQAFVIANFPLGFLMFLTGAAFPLPRFNFLTVAGRGIALADFLPPTHAVIALNKIFTLGAGPGEVLFELTVLFILTILYFGVGVWLFQRTQMQ
jgi:ABC-2 type transport system permease protein